MLVCVVGLGQIGLPVAQYAHVKGHEVWGYDINPKIIEKTKTEDFKTTDIWEEIPPAEIYIVCVTTSYTDEGPNLSPVFNVCKSISQKAKKETIVSIESTITPGTSKKIYTSIFNKNIKFIIKYNLQSTIAPLKLHSSVQSSTNNHSMIKVHFKFPCKYNFLH